MSHHLLSPQNDLVFKRIFGTDRNKAFLSKMLNSVLVNQLTSPIVSIVFVTDTMRHSPIVKETIVDIRCQDEKGNRYVIEMQVAKTDSFLERVQFYVARALSNQLYVGQDYAKAKRVIFLGFTGYPLFPHKATYKSEHATLDQKSYEGDLNHLRYVFIELSKFEKQCQKTNDSLTLEERFYRFLNQAHLSDPQDREALIGGDEDFAQAFRELERASWSPEELALYDDIQDTIRNNYDAEVRRRADAIAKAQKEGKQEGIKEGVEKGKKEGEARGIEKGKLEIAKAMHRDGVDLEIIKKHTGIDPSRLA